jgi:hypothetical protein
MATLSLAEFEADDMAWELELGTGVDRDNSKVELDAEAGAKVSDDTEALWLAEFEDEGEADDMAWELEMAPDTKADDCAAVKLAIALDFKDDCAVLELDVIDVLE